MINGLLVVFIHPTTLISANFGYDQILKPTITNWPTQPNPWTRPVPPRSTTIPNAINELSSRRDNSLLVDVMITHFFHFLSFRLGISLLRCWWRLSFFFGTTCDAHYRRLWHWTFPALHWLAAGAAALLLGVRFWGSLRAIWKVCAITVIGYPIAKCFAVVFCYVTWYGIIFDHQRY